MTDLLFSIVVPTRDRPLQIGACLSAIGGLAFPRQRYEVVVVDDGSRHPIEAVDGCRVVRLAGHGPAAARNAGAEVARGRWLAFTDDDCRPRPDWLSALSARLEADPRAAFGGRTVNRLQDNPWSAASQLLIDWLYHWQDGRPSAGRFFTTSNMAVAAEAFREVGGFDATFPAPGGEDRDFCERWSTRGLPLVHAPEAIVEHEHALGASAFWRQHAGYGRGARRLQRRRAARGGRMWVEPPAFYLGMLRYPFERGVAGPWRQSALLGVAQLANAAGYASARLSELVRPR